MPQRADLEARFAAPLTLRQRNRVQVLLRANAGETDADIADDLGICAQTAANVRKRFAAEGLEAALAEKPRPGGPARLDGKGEAVVIALACSPVPEGRVTWTAAMLANKLVELRVVESVSEDTILRVIKKATSSRGRRRVGACPRGLDGEFVYKMEDVLELYAEPRDPARPVVCFDECSKELRGHIAEAVPAAPGRRGRTTSTHGTAPPTCSSWSSRSRAGGTSR